jgi:hypothetical protein
MSRGRMLDCDPNGSHQRYRMESHSHFSSCPDRGRQLTHGCEPMLYCAYKKVKRLEACTTRFTVTQPSPLHSLSNWSLRRNNGGKTPHHHHSCCRLGDADLRRIRNPTPSQMPFVDCYHFINKNLYADSIVMSSSSSKPMTSWLNALIGVIEYSYHQSISSFLKV